MKTNLGTRVALAMLLAALVISNSLSAQESQDHHQHHHYQLVDMGTFGGPQSDIPDGGSAALLTNHGVLVGGSDTPTPDPFPDFCFVSDCVVSHAFQYQNGAVSDLGVLPNGWSSASTWISPNGLVAGFSQNGEIDPLFAGFPEMQSVLWQQGAIVDLGSLPEGGYESVANAVNSRGQVVGAALNTVPDDNSMISYFDFFPPIPYQTRAFLWDGGNGMKDLGTLPGGTDAQARLINERGQVVGWSYTSSAPSSPCSSNFNLALTTGSFLWEKGKGMVDLGGLGGTCNLATGLNDRGQVVGQSWLAGDEANQPFLWERATGLVGLGTLGGSGGGASTINEQGQVVGGSLLPGDVQIDAFLWDGAMHDLGALGSDTCAWAFSINASRQVVGHSNCFSDNIRGFLWERGGPMVDLNTLVPPGASLYVIDALDINDRGEIGGNGVDADGNEHALLLIPCDDNHPDVEGCDYSLVDATAVSVRPPHHSPAAMPQSRRTSLHHTAGMGRPIH
jgi:probable HAF family extracellular repeat protein